jgi:hypothetical protein
MLPVGWVDGYHLTCFVGVCIVRLPTNKGVGMDFVVSSHTQVLPVTQDLFPLNLRRSFRGPVVNLFQEGSRRHTGIGMVVNQVDQERVKPESGAELIGLVLRSPTLFESFEPFGRDVANGMWWCLDRSRLRQVRLRRWSTENERVLENRIILSNLAGCTSVCVESLYVFWEKLRHVHICRCDGETTLSHLSILSPQNSVLLWTLAGDYQLMHTECFDTKVRLGKLKASDVLVDGRTIMPHSKVETFDQSSDETDQDHSA